MAQTTLETVILVAVMSGLTFLLRGLAFIIFPAGKETPKFIMYLSKTLPYATMAMLIVYCLKDVSVFSGSHGLPELIAILVVAVLQVWQKNSLLSIGTGTVLYMFLVQSVFI